VRRSDVRADDEAEAEAETACGREAGAGSSKTAAATTAAERKRYDEVHVRRRDRRDDCPFIGCATAIRVR
jgi:hypothetical protein